MRRDEGPVGDGTAMNDRAERLKAALRENLKRRKAQVRGRTAADRPDAASGAGKPDRDPEPPSER